MFEIIENFRHPVLDRFRACLKANDIQIAGVEMLIDEGGQASGAGAAWAYDINTNTNYNPEAEAAAGLTATSRAGMHAIAGYLGRELAALELVTDAA